MFTPPGGGLIQFYPDTADTTAQQAVKVTAGRISTITENVLPNGGVFGQIVSNRGVPVAGAMVGIEAGPRATIRTTTDAEGNYEIGYLAPAVTSSMPGGRSARPCSGILERRRSVTPRRFR